MKKDGKNGLQETDTQSQGWQLKSLWNWFGFSSGSSVEPQLVQQSPLPLDFAKDQLPQGSRLDAQNCNQNLRKRND